MNHCFKTVISIVLILITIHSCSQNKINHPPECIKLNNEGVSYLMNYPMNGEKGLNKAIDLFKQAINCDSTNTVFYTSLATAYEKKHNYNGEMMMLDKSLKLTANNPDLLLEKGMLFEVKGNFDSAKIIYHLTQVEYEKRLNKQPDEIGLIKGFILLKGVIGGKEAAIKELDKQIKIHPKFSLELSKEYSFYQYFNRHNFVFRLPTERDLDK